MTRCRDLARHHPVTDRLQFALRLHLHHRRHDLGQATGQPALHQLLAREPAQGGEALLDGALDALCGGHDVAVRLLGPPDLPLVAMDDVLIEQVLVNLLDNAVKHTPPGSAIRILATATEGRVTVEVADDGPGLPPGEEDRVFEKFYQAGPGRGSGAGLGLAICRGIVEAHGGRIWAQNLPEGGVAFLFTLPAADAPAPPASVDA